MRKKQRDRWITCLSGFAGELVFLLLGAMLMAALVTWGKLGEGQLRPAAIAAALAGGIAGGVFSAIGGRRKTSLVVCILGSLMLYCACGLLLGREGEGGSALNLPGALAAILVPLGMLLAGSREGRSSRKKHGRQIHNR